MFAHTVTLYNAAIKDGAETWRRTVLHGVLWCGSFGASGTKDGMRDMSTLEVIIPDKPGYVTPEVYRGATGTWTLRPGDKMLLGEIRKDIDRTTKELESLGQVMTITSVETLGFGGTMRHWEVQGK